MCRKTSLITVAIIYSFILIALFIRCEADNPASIYDPDKIGNPTPVITKLIPADSSLAGIGKITIIGENFSPTAEENLVFFDKTKVEVISATETELKIKTPNIIGDSIGVKIAVQGAYLFSNVFNYKLAPAVWEYGDFDEYDDAYGLAMDSDENLYVSLAGKKIVKVTPTGEQLDYSATLTDKASAMKMGPGGYIYYVNLLQYMFIIPPGGGTNEIFAILPGGVFDLDFDSNGNIFCGGSGKAIYCIKADGSNRTVADYNSIYIKSVRVYNGYVYIAGEYTGEDSIAVQIGIWRNQILNADGDLGDAELVFDWGSKFNYTVHSINFSANGDLYVGTDAPEAIIIIHPDGSYEPLYPGVIEPESYALCWGNRNYLYVNRRSIDPAKKRIIKINVQTNGAPYYGRQ